MGFFKGHIQRSAGVPCCLSKCCNGVVCKRHCKTEFKKQVLPVLMKPNEVGAGMAHCATSGLSYRTRLVGDGRDEGCPFVVDGEDVTVFEGCDS